LPADRLLVGPGRRARQTPPAHSMDPQVGGAVEAQRGPRRVVVKKASLAHTGAEPELGVLDVGVEKVLDKTRWELRRRQVSVLGRRLGNPVLLARPRIIYDGAGASPPAAVGHALVVILEIHLQGVADLPEVGETDRLSRFGARLREDGKENRGQDSNDGDH